jgi:hypothetical protein
MIMNKFKSILIFFIFISIFTIFKASNSEAYSEPNCTVTGGKVVAPPSSGNTFCVTETDVVKVTIREVGLCESSPSAPTTSAQFNGGSGGDGQQCSKIYYDPTGVGETVSISKTSNIALKDSYTLDPNKGTYNYGYVITSNIQTVSFVKEFTTSIYSDGVSTNGPWCGTKNNVTLLDNNSKYLNGTICGTESDVRAASGERQELIYNVCPLGTSCQDSDGTGGGSFVATLNFTNINNTGRSLDVYIANKSDGKLPAAVSNTERNLLWIQQLSAPITTTGDDTITIAFDKSSVATVENNGGTPNNKYFLSGGPVELLISATSGEVF